MQPKPQFPLVAEQVSVAAKRGYYPESGGHDEIRVYLEPLLERFGIPDGEDAWALVVDQAVSRFCIQIFNADQSFIMDGTPRRFALIDGKPVQLIKFSRHGKDGALRRLEINRKYLPLWDVSLGEWELEVRIQDRFVWLSRKPQAAPVLKVVETQKPEDAWLASTVVEFTARVSLSSITIPNSILTKIPVVPQKSGEGMSAHYIFDDRDPKRLLIFPRPYNMDVEDITKRGLIPSHKSNKTAGNSWSFANDWGGGGRGKTERKARFVRFGSLDWFIEVLK
jgi:hypothetical protein